MNEQVTVFGASGRVGRLVVAELLARGYKVVAVVHRKNRLRPRPGLRIATGDIYDADAVDEALAGSQIVVSCLSSWGTVSKDILTVGTRHIIAAMKRREISRIVSLTGADARAAGDTLSLIHRLTHSVLRVIVPRILGDGEQHISLLEHSQLDWTVLRSPIMTKRTLRRPVHVSDRRPLPWQRVSRRAVALAMVALVQSGAQVCHAPYIS
jgi:putative NADH-flavin reductase